MSAGKDWHARVKAALLWQGKELKREGGRGIAEAKSKTHREELSHSPISFLNKTRQRNIITK